MRFAVFCFIMMGKRKFMTRLILHIGSQKTGTTSLQQFLQLNRKILNKNGMDYPHFSQGGCTNGLPWVRHLNGVDVNSSDFRELKESIEKYDTVILSAEQLWSEGRIYDPRPEEWKNVPYFEQCKQFFSQLGIDVFDIVVYLRRQDQYISSSWKQWVKVGFLTCMKEDVFEIPFYKMTCDYNQRIEGLEKIFGKDNIHIRLYGQEAFVGGNIYKDFCSCIGLSWDDEFELLGGYANRSLTFDVTEAIRRLVLQYGCQERFLIDVIFPTAFRYSKKHPDPKGMSLYTFQEQVDILDKYHMGNQRIAKDYFDRDQLFSKPTENGETWEANEETVQLVLKLFKIQYYANKMPSKKLNEFLAEEILTYIEWGKIPWKVILKKHLKSLMKKK